MHDLRLFGMILSDQGFSGSAGVSRIVLFLSPPIFLICKIVESPPLFFAESLAALAECRELTSRQMQGAMQEIMAGRWNDSQIAAFLTGLRIKGETGEEIAAAAAVLRE